VEAREDRKAQVAALLRGLREHGVDELFLDRLTAVEARRLLSGAGPGGGALEALRAESTGCVKCRLSQGRRQVVFGRGSEAARLVVVGEAPGSEEDRTGLPFVGPAGKLLDLLLLSVGFDRESVYICNVIKCRPPNNRDPQADEVSTCSPYLHGQLDAIQPRVLLAVGRFAAQVLTGSEAGIGQLRGRQHEYRGIPVVATYHPAYLLRSPDATRKTWQDLQLMRQVMDEHV
jgi:DNA polymerase